VEFFKQILF